MLKYQTLTFATVLLGLLYKKTPRNREVLIAVNQTATKKTNYEN